MTWATHLQQAELLLEGQMSTGLVLHDPAASILGNLLGTKVGAAHSHGPSKNGRGHAEVLLHSSTSGVQVWLDSSCFLVWSYHFTPVSMAGVGWT